MESQKESSYKQYYQQFVDNQNRLHSMYDKAAHQDNLKDHSREELVARGIEEQRQRQMREYHDTVQRTPFQLLRRGTHQGTVAVELAASNRVKGTSEAAGKGRTSACLTNHQAARTLESDAGPNGTVEEEGRSTSVRVGPEFPGKHDS